jgi:hypothetical protein
MFGPSLIVRLRSAYGSLLSTTMTSADFSYITRDTETSPGKSAFLHLIPAASTDRGLLVSDFVKMCSLNPPRSASVCRSCSSVPRFAVSLPSVLVSQQTTLRLANRLHQLACKRLSLSGIFWYLRYQRPCWAHTKCIINGGVQCKFVV